MKRKISLINQQTVKKINRKKLYYCLKKVTSFLNISDQKISIIFCDNRFISAINKKFLKHLGPTDVISFPLKDTYDPDYLGEIIVSVEEAVKSAKKLNCPWQDELFLYVVHGILHLLGYKDYTLYQRKLMQKKQESVLRSCFC